MSQYLSVAVQSSGSLSEL